MKKSGIVALIGRPNSGKSTLLNALIGQKVAITSPKPQTTRFTIQAVYEDERGQIIFFDTPGIFAKVEDALSAKINLSAEEVLKQNVDLVIYIVDHTRERDIEENKTLGLVRKVDVPKILVFNKIDIKQPSYYEQYAFLEDEFDIVVKVSALKHKNLNILLEKVFECLPEGEPLVSTKGLVQPAINLDSATFIAELIREKAFLMLRREVPYQLTATVSEITERETGMLYIKATIFVSADRYKKMIIGEGGRMIKAIGSYARKELELATQKKVYLDLTVETDPHWMERLI